MSDLEVALPRVSAFLARDTELNRRYHAGEMHKAAVRRQRGELPAWATTEA